MTLQASACSHLELHVYGLYDVTRHTGQVLGCYICNTTHNLSSPSGMCFIGIHCLCCFSCGLRCRRLSGSVLLLVPVVQLLLIPHIFLLLVLLSSSLPASQQLRFFMTSNKQSITWVGHICNRIYYFLTHEEATVRYNYKSNSSQLTWQHLF